MSVTPALVTRMCASWVHRGPYRPDDTDQIFAPYGPQVRTIRTINAIILISCSFNRVFINLVKYYSLCKYTVFFWRPYIFTLLRCLMTYVSNILVLIRTTFADHVLNNIIFVLIEYYMHQLNKTML